MLGHVMDGIHGTAIKTDNVMNGIHGTAIKTDHVSVLGDVFHLLPHRTDATEFARPCLPCFGRWPS